MEKNLSIQELVDQLPNPFWQEVKSDYMNILVGSSQRLSYIIKYGYEVPSPFLLSSLLEYVSMAGWKPVVSFGCGDAYIESLLAMSFKLLEVKATMTAIDREIPHFHFWEWEGVQQIRTIHGLPYNLRRFSEHTLLLIWSPFSEGGNAPDMALEALFNYQGKHIILVGEYRGSCASKAFFYTLEQDWDEVDWKPIPTWDWCSSGVGLFKRK